eukprot:GGOE01007375.1.p1 GENE.GGOE01007375.1~~GGOE01007375.1.p1  ORF type:complete len:382 (-),score=67.49 GGOE01007375.1:1036-2127(-)
MPATYSFTAPVEQRRTGEAPATESGFVAPGFGYIADLNHIHHGVWVGGQRALHPRTLVSKGIRHVLNASVELASSMDWAELQRNGISVRHVRWADSHHQRIHPLSQEAQAALQFIEQCVTRAEPVIVNCQMGMSRSPSLAIAYFIVHEGMSFANAFALVKGGRPTIHPNSGFIQQLERLAEDQLCGNGAPLAAGHTNPAPALLGPVPRSTLMPEPWLSVAPAAPMQAHSHIARAQTKEPPAIAPAPSGKSEPQPTKAKMIPYAATPQPLNLSFSSLMAMLHSSPHPAAVHHPIPFQQSPSISYSVPSQHHHSQLAQQGASHALSPELDRYNGWNYRPAAHPYDASVASAAYGSPHIVHSPRMY